MGISKAYLLAYNVSQFCGWTYLMYRLLPYLRLQAKATTFFPAKNPASLYVELGDHVKLVLMAAILEIVHAAIGIVRSNPMVCAVQIAGRLAVVWLPIHFIAASQVLYMSSSFWLLGVESRDFSHAEKGRTA
jgi:very-long-chain (3R)-3-hydroxyacyl-CoA dehydratase